MRSCLMLAMLSLTGCGQSPVTEIAQAESAAAVVDDQATEQLRQLARVQWQHETRRMKEREIYASTDPEAWAICASARTLRMLSIGDADDAETILPIMFTTDEAFWKTDPPPDSTILLYADFMKSYRAAALISEQKLRLRGMAELADKLNKFIGEPK